MNSAFAYARSLGIKTVRLVIHQPKVDGTTESVITLEELEEFAALARSKACSVENAARDYGKVPDEQWNKVYLNPTPNEVECAFCRAMPTCPNAQYRVLDVLDHSDFTTLPELMIDEADIRNRSDYKLAKAMAAAPFIEDFIKSVRAETERRLLSGVPVEGFGLELGRQGNRKFKDAEEAETLLRKGMRLKVEDVFDFSLKNPTQIEKLAKPTKDEEGAVLPPVIGPRQWKKVEALIVRADPKPSVKRADKIKKPYELPKPSSDDFDVVTNATGPEDGDEDLF